MAVSLSWEHVTPRLRALFAGLSIIALLAGGCSANSGDDASDATDLTTVGESPLDAYLSIDTRSVGANDRQRLFESKVQECMNSQGFGYVTSDVDMTMFNDRRLLSPPEFAAEHGYGLIDSWVAARSDLPEDRVHLDSNKAVLATMSATEQEAWEDAYYGPPIEQADLDQGTDEMTESSGCFHEAGSEARAELKVLEELGPSLEAMDAAILADPRIVEINTKWTACMSDAGYDDFGPFDDARMHISDKIAKLTVSDSATLAEDSGDPLVEGESSPERVPLLEKLRPQLDELRAEEIAIATADLKCQADDYTQIQEIRREYELQFVEDNKAILEVNS